MAKSKPDRLNISSESTIDVGDAPPILSPETEFEKLLQEETARFNLPLALRKSPRATAGLSMKYTNMHRDDMDDEVIFNKPMPKPSKDIKFGTKRKLDLLSSPTASPGKIKHHHHHHKDKPKKDKHKHKHKESESVEDYIPPFSKKQRIGALRDQDSRNDFYCWYCHKEGSVICCELCPRVYHTRCLKIESEPDGDWVCPVCQKVLESECVDTQSEAMSKLSVNQLSRLLNFSLKRMKHQGTDSFQKPVSLKHFPDYASYVFNSMDLGTLEQNIKKNVYGSTYAFLEETKWILHNCIIFNGSHHKLTNRAKSIVKICDYEMNEIEICPNCYLSSCQKRENWFCEPCDPPHIIVWAKLQGFPYWQAKVLRESKGQVDVRFFGQHDRAWIPMSNCYLISKESPTATKKQISRLANATRELKIYGENIRSKFGSFDYHPLKTHYKAGMSAQSKTVDSSTPAMHLKSPAKPFQALSGKPAAFMNGIREAEAAEQMEEEEDEETKDVDVSGDDDDESVSGLFGDKTRLASESASIDENSMDSVSQDSSSVCSMGSSQNEDKTEVGTSDEKVADCSATQKSRMGGGTPTRVADCSQKSRMGGMKVVVKKLSAKPASDGKMELTPKSAEFVRKKIVQVEDTSPKRSKPAGVFEITDRSLDIDQEKKSPSAQLLGKTHISPKRLKMSPGKSSVSPKKSTGESTEKDSSTSDKCRTEDIVVKGKVKSAINKDGDKESGSIILPSKLPDLPSKLPDASSLVEADEPPKTPESGTPSSSTQGTPRSSDKFHMKLSKTIETMKASLGVESMETNENSESDSESENTSPRDLEHDSDSSDDAHSEDKSSVKSDTQKEKSGEQESVNASPDKKTDEIADKDDGESQSCKTKFSKGQEMDEVFKDQESDKVIKDKVSDEVVKYQVSDEVGKYQVSDEVSKYQVSDEVSKYQVSDEVSKYQESDKVSKDEVSKDQESDVASECGGLAMSCQSADDQSENELVIDMDRVDGHQETDSASKEPSSKKKSSKISNEVVNKDAKLDDGDKSKTQADNAVIESDSAKQVNNSSSAMECDTSTSTTSETSKLSSSMPTMPKLNMSPRFKKLQLAKSNQNPIAPKIVTSTSVQSILASHLTEIVQQKEHGEKKQLNTMVVSETKSTEVPNEKKTVNDATASSDAKEDVKVDESMELDVVTDDYPFEEEDPLKAWGTADHLLDKYANQVSKVVKDSLTSARREFIDSVTSVDVKTTIDKLQSQVARLSWEKDKQKQELQHIMDLTIAEMRDSLNADLKKCEASTHKEAQKEKEVAIRETKKKQWCAQCEQEAFFYCCWNTSYCSYTCQQSHWSSHQNSCQQSNATRDNTQNMPQQPVIAGQNTNTIVTASPTATTLQAVSSSNNSIASTIRLISTPSTQQRGLNQPLQLVQKPTVVTAAQSSSTMTPPSVQTLIRYVQAPPRMPMQSGGQTQAGPLTIRLPSGGGQQLVTTVPATIRQMAGGQQQIVLTGQTLQNLKMKSNVATPNIYNV